MKWLWIGGGLVVVSGGAAVAFMLRSSSSPSSQSSTSNSNNSVNTMSSDRQKKLFENAKDTWRTMEHIIPFKQAFGPVDGQNYPDDWEPVMQLMKTVLRFEQDMRKWGWQYILSGYRNKAYNEKIGGIKGSYHTLGMALDFRPIADDRGFLLEMGKDLVGKGWRVLIYEANSISEGNPQRTFVHVNLGQTAKILWKDGTSWLTYPKTPDNSKVWESFDTKNPKSPLF